MLICGRKGVNMNKAFNRLIAAFAVLSVSAAFISGCSGMQVPSGLSAAASTSAKQSETTSETSVSESSKATQAKTEATEKTVDTTFTQETVNEKKKDIEGTAYAAGTTYLGESQNRAALEVVLAEFGVDEKVIGSDETHLIDCGGTDIWFICFSSDVTSVKVVLGDEEDGKELYKADNPGYIFIRCYSMGEVPSCTVIITGQKTGYTTYYPYLIGGDIVLPNGGTVMNQTEGVGSFIDVPDETNNSDETEEEVP